MPHTRDCSSPTNSAESRAPYETPPLSDLQRLFWFRGGSDNHVDQVWPNVYLGDAWAARSKTTLQSLNITHILNAADGPYSINTGAKYYKDLQIEYYGVEAFDDPSFDLSVFFYDAANFIGKALNTSGGKVFVHCAMGVSRSASLVLAFLMIHENMTLVDALKTVSSHRDICPNSGFLSQLRDLDIQLNEGRKGTRASTTKELKIHPGDTVENISEEEGGFPAEAPNSFVGSGRGCKKAFDNEVQHSANLSDRSTL